MTRIEMVRRLLGEGLSRNTLVNFTDKQLSSLCERMLNEGVTKVATADTKTQDQLKQQKKPFELYEKKKPTTKQLTALDKNKNGKLDKEDFKMLGSKKSPKEEVKENLKGGQTKLDTNKNGKIDKEDFKLLKKGKTETKVCSKCGMKNCKCKHSKTEVKKGNSKLKEGVEVTNWVKGLAEEKYHPYTSKNEIMELIKTKLNEVETASIPMPSTKAKKGHNGIPEFMTYDAIIKAAEPEENPGIKEAPPEPDVDRPVKTPKQDPREDPFTPKQPGQRPNPSPKAGIKKTN